MKKAELRNLYLQKMRALNPQDHELKCKKIAEIFFSSVPLTDYNTLHTFLPIVKNNEVNTWLIIDEAVKIKPTLKILIPKSDFSTFEMTTHVLSKEVKMVLNQSGILEPHDEEYFDEQEIDLVLLPLLAFDKKGFRAGYGKGFYDRFLAKCRKDTLKIGLSLFPPIDKIQDVNENDIALDKCITPDGIINF